VLVAAEALAGLGLGRLSYDLTMPPLVPTLLDEAGFEPGQRASLGRALDRKDAAAVQARGGALAGTLTDLLLAAGPARRALDALRAASLTPAARRHAERLTDTVAAIQARAPALKLTVDPVEFRGFKYHTGVSLSVFAPGRHEELGRGGRYVCGESDAGSGAAGEPATGVTLYPDAVLRALPRPVARPRLYLPPGTDPARAAALRAAGFATVAGFDPADPVAAARAQACTHVLSDGEPVAVAE